MSVFLKALTTAVLAVAGVVGVGLESRAASGFRPEVVQEMEAAIQQAIRDGECPGAVVWLEREGVVYRQALGDRARTPTREPMTEETVFDLASLTKAVACAPAVMVLAERGKLKLDDPVGRHVPEFAAHGKEAVTIRHLLLHTSGLRPGIDPKGPWEGWDGAVTAACREKLVTAPGSAFRYSDINFIVLGEVVRRVSGRPLQEFVQEELFAPLKMRDTGYLPPVAERARIAPTEVVNGQALRGVVHDPTARRMGGVAGHAGLFSTASDLARFARMLLNGGELDGVRVMKPETVRLMTSVQSPPALAARRGLGWDIDSAYSGPRGERFPIGSYGHTGWTGTSLWIDPFSRTFLILLANRNHPSEKGSVTALRRRLGTLAAEAVVGFDFSSVKGALPPRPAARGDASKAGVPSGAGVLNGIDVLVRDRFALLAGRRVGLITNHTGHDRSRNATIDLFRRAEGLELKALFSPEHGIRGNLDERLGDSVDAATGLPVFSLYGAALKPSPEQLAGLDTLVFDIQDIGCRFYTYAATMALAMEAAAAAGLKFVVLDRVNPIGGVAFDGPLLGADPTFVGYHAVPVQHGLTVGELAALFKAERLPEVDLTIVRVENWRRDMFLDETGLPWTNPSPNMRSLEAAILYPGLGLLESAVSVGRGTDSPFQVVGAPYVDDVELAAVLNGAGLAGVRFLAVRFTPTASIHAGQACGGVRVLLLDRRACRSVEVGLTMARVLYRLYPQDFDPGKMAHLLLDPPTLQAVREDRDLGFLRGLWAAGQVKFAERRAAYLLYP